MDFLSPPVLVRSRYPITSEYVLMLSLGLMAMPRSPFKVPEDAEEASEEGGVVDASLLPPG